jgi:hypothetical protein
MRGALTIIPVGDGAVSSKELAAPVALEDLRGVVVTGDAELMGGAVMMDTDFIVIGFGSFGMLVVWGPYGRAYHSIILTSLEPEYLEAL